MLQTTIIIADDHPLIRKGLKEVIEEHQQFKVIAEAGDGECALRLIEELQPDLAILDHNMPKLSGMDVLKALSRKRLAVRSIMLTMHTNEDAFDKAMELGTMGFLVKDNALTDIITCLTMVAEGKQYISPHISSMLVKRHVATNGEKDSRLQLAELTATERKVLSLVAQNKSSKEIAEQMFVSVRTVENHRANICGKLNLNGPNALLRFVLENKEMLA